MVFGGAHRLRAWRRALLRCHRFVMTTNVVVFALKAFALTAANQRRRMLNDRQKLFIDEYMKDMKPMAAAERAGYSAPPWTEEVRAEVDARIRDRKEVFEIEGSLVLREIATVAFHNVNLDELKPADKIKALELLGKNLKLFTEQVEHSLTEGLADKLAAARERVKALQEARANDPEELTQ
jgi:hypothetical protein